MEFFRSLADYWRNLTLPQKCFFAALLLYGLFSSPTPDALSLAEIIIIALLALSIGLTSVFRIVSGVYFLQAGLPVWMLAGNAALLYFLTVPIALGLVYGASPYQMGRDLAPMLTAFLPLLLYSRMQQDGRQWRKIIPAGLIFIGVSFSVRYFFIIDRLPWQIGSIGYRDNFLYLPLSPEVLFAALALSVLGMTLSVRRGKVPVRSRMAALLCATLSALCMAAMAGMLLRAALALAASALGMLLILYLRRAPQRLPIIALVAACAFFACAAPLNAIVTALQTKEQSAGLNQRDAEFRAAVLPLLDNASDTWLGIGWGSNVLSPAVGGQRVPYTHTFISYLWVKSGLTGLFLMFAYVFALALTVLRQKQNWHALLLVVFLPLGLSLTLYTSYKTFGFGVLLAYLAAHAFREDENNEKNSVC